jgi:hypothetical protein
MRAIMEGAGLADLRFYGAFDGAPFDSQSERMVVTARKPGD